MDSKYESCRGVRTYLVLNGMNINEFGIDPDMTFNNSSETMKSTYQHKANLIIKLMKYWNPWKSFSLNWWMMGIMELTVFVKFEMSFWKLWACKYNPYGMLSVAKTYLFWCYCKMKRFTKYCLLMSLTQISSTPYDLERKVFYYITLN